MTCTQGQVLYDSAARDADATVTYDGTAVVGKEFQNSFDWRDFSLFEVIAGETNVNLDILTAGGRTIDCAGLFIKPLDTGDTATIILKYESSVGVFTTIATFNITDAGAIIVEDFTSQAVAATRKIRWDITTNAGPMDIRQLTTGERLDFPIGQRDGLAPPNLNGDLVIDTSIAVNGSVLGRSVRRLDHPSTIDLEYLSETFIRTDWEQFTDHAISNSFFYRHDKVNFPDEANFSTATAINRPSNMMPPPLMMVSMPLKNLVPKDNI